MKKLFFSLVLFLSVVSASTKVFAYFDPAGKIPEDFLKVLNKARGYGLIPNEFRYTYLDAEIGLNMDNIVEDCTSGKKAYAAEVNYNIKDGQFRVSFYTDEISGLTSINGGFLVSKWEEKDKYRTTCKLKADGEQRLHEEAYYSFKSDLDKAIYKEAEENGTIARLEAERKARIEEAKKIWQKYQWEDGSWSGAILARKSKPNSPMNVWYLHYDKSASTFIVGYSMPLRIPSRTEPELKRVLKICSEQSWGAMPIGINGKSITFKPNCEIRNNGLEVFVKPQTQEGLQYFISELKKKNKINIVSDSTEIEISAKGFSKVYNELREYYKK